MLIAGGYPSWQHIWKYTSLNARSDLEKEVPSYGEERSLGLGIFWVYRFLKLDNLDPKDAEV